ncbi:TDP-fucosamine acetyltransferase [Serratia rubidaea]|uniref:TDP-fucosamine acetyltransferase n=1 Tax=Serratia rubidaea TaxID=61652 RepID=A0A447QM29_SERRU|nr:TDP-fucosamine acetyltransferase [Serratia rubidaea]
MILRATVDPLTWESDYFRINSAKLNIADSAPPLTAAALDRFALVQAKIPAHRLDLADALTALGFQLAEGEVDLVINIGTERASKPASGVRPATVPILPCYGGGRAGVRCQSFPRALVSAGGQRTVLRHLD